MSRLLETDSDDLRLLHGVEPLPLGDRPAADDLVLIASGEWRADSRFRDIVERAVRVARASDAAAVVVLDGRGEELQGFRLVRGGLQPEGPPSRWYPIVLDDTEYDPAGHRTEAETYRDRIGDRLLRPEAVEPDKRHLIADDHQRAMRVLELGHQGRVLDVGTSDGTLLLRTVRRWNLSGAVGVDVADSAIAEASLALANQPDLSGRVTFIAGFIEDLVFPDGAFDMVSACETLEHIGPGQFELALGNLMRMLRSGGTLLMTVPNRYPVPHYEREGRARWSWPAHHQFFTECSVRRLLAPLFETLEFIPLYDGEPAGDSIYLICRGRHRR